MSIRETLSKLRAMPVPTNERATIFQILTPILDSLGWDRFGSEVLWEYQVGDGRVGIGLQGPEDVVALIEAKAPSQDLRRHVKQVLGYAFHEGVDICVLTTGLEWWLYLPREAGPPEKRRFAILNIVDDSIEQLASDLETFLGKEALLSGQAKTRAKLVLEAQQLAARLNKELPAIWKAMLAEPDDDLIELVRRRTYEEMNLRPDREQVAAVLLGSPVPTVLATESVVPPSEFQPLEPATEPAPRPIPTATGASRTGSKQLTTPAKGSKPTSMTLWGQRYPLVHWRDVIVRIVEALHQCHGNDFERILTVRGRKRPYVSRNPDDLLRAAEVPEIGFYVDVNLSAVQVMKRAADLLGHFGHPASDLEVFTGTKSVAPEESLAKAEPTTPR